MHSFNDTYPAFFRVAPLQSDKRVNIASALTRDISSSEQDRRVFKVKFIMYCTEITTCSVAGILPHVRKFREHDDGKTDLQTF